MSQRNSVERIRTLVTGHKAGHQDASFRNDYNSALQDGTRQELFSQEDADLLKHARTLLESWIGHSPPAGGEALTQWLSLYESGKTRLPTSLLEAFLRRVPKVAPREFDWPRLLLGTRDKKLISTLVTQHRVKASELASIAKSNASQFFDSASLDALIDHGVTVPRAVWTSLSEGTRRPKGLLAADEALARSFASDTKPDACKWLVRFLAERPSLRRGVLRGVLRHSGATNRFVQYLTSAGLSPTGKRKKVDQSLIAAIVGDLLHVCELAIDEKTRVAPVASSALGFLQLAATSASEGFDVEALQAIVDTSSRIGQRAIVQALRDAEGKDPSSRDDQVIVVRSDHLYSAVQIYLRNLSSGPDGDMSSPERALRNERYLGRREILQGLLPAFDGATEKSALKDALDAVLYNAGVRPLGNSGQRVIFDFRLHEPETSGILPGDDVVITRAGWALGDVENAVILTKARAKLAV
jgi:hypothetical protein